MKVALGREEQQRRLIVRGSKWSIKKKNKMTGHMEPDVCYTQCLDYAGFDFIGSL